MTISGGKKHYYITANNGRMDAEVYLDKIGVTVKNTTSSDETNNNQSSNVEENDNENQNNEEQFNDIEQQVQE